MLQDDNQTLFMTTEQVPSTLRQVKSWIPTQELFYSNNSYLISFHFLFETTVQLTCQNVSG